MADATEYMKKFYEAIRDERMTAANTATRIGNAFLMLLQYLTSDSPFLRKDREETTEFLFKLLAGAVIGESGQIKLNPDGSISCQRITVEGSAVFNELVVVILDTADKLIEYQIKLVAEAVYVLTIKKRCKAFPINRRGYLYTDFFAQSGENVIEIYVCIVSLVFRNPRSCHNERNTNAMLINTLLAEPTVLTDSKTVIARKHDYGVVFFA